VSSARRRSNRDAVVIALVGRPAAAPDPARIDLDGFWREFDSVAPIHVRAGFRVAAAVIGTIAPRLCGHASGLAGLDRATAESVVERAAGWKALAPLIDAATIVSCFAYFADDEAETAIRHGAGHATEARA
jgi:hypothetical protein